METTEQATTEPNTSTIKFTYAEGGEIDFNAGHTVFNDLFMIGAFSLTGKFKGTSEALYKEYPTDVKGLEMLQSKSGEALRLISSTITTLGLMLAYVDRRELGDNQLDSYAWLVTGLGEWAW